MAMAWWQVGVAVSASFRKAYVLPGCFWRNISQHIAMGPRSLVSCEKMGQFCGSIGPVHDPGPIPWWKIWFDRLLQWDGILMVLSWCKLRVGFMDLCFFFLWKHLLSKCCVNMTLTSLNCGWNLWEMNAKTGDRSQRNHKLLFWKRVVPITKRIIFFSHTASWWQ